MSTILVKKSVLEDVGYIDENRVISEDADLYLRVLRKGYKMDYVPEVLVNRVLHLGNQHGTVHNRPFLARMELYNKWFNTRFMKSN